MIKYKGTFKKVYCAVKHSVDNQNTRGKLGKVLCCDTFYTSSVIFRTFKKHVVR